MTNPDGIKPVPPTPAAATTPGANDGDYVIGAEDVIEISVWREPELGVRATVRPDGKIGIRLLNDVQAGGLTTKQLKEYLRESFSQYVTDPVVSVIVTEVHSQMVHVIGNVARPGLYPLGGPLTVVELLARAGGLSDFAKKENITIVRSEAGKTRRMMFNYKSFVQGQNLQQNLELRNGDVVIVP